MTAPARGNWFTRGGWWFLVHVLSFGFLAPVPFGIAANRTRRPVHVALAVLAGLLAVATFVLILNADRLPDGRFVGPANAAANVTWPVLFIGGLVGLVVVRQQVYAAPRPAHADPAVAAALAARGRRAEARRLVAADPMLAREVRVGRPDLVRTYDDGGLVDLNAAPAPVIGQVLGLEPAHAAAIVQARQAAGRFGSVEDVFAWADLPYAVWDQVRERAVVIG